MRELVLLVLLSALPGPALAEDLGDLGVPVRATPNLLAPVDRPTTVRLLPSAACWLEVGADGRARIRGTNVGPCVDILDEAVRLARNENRVNRQKRRKP